MSISIITQPIPQSPSLLAHRSVTHSEKLSYLHCLLRPELSALPPANSKENTAKEDMGMTLLNCLVYSDTNRESCLHPGVGRYGTRFVIREGIRKLRECVRLRQGLVVSLKVFRQRVNPVRKSSTF